jgi:hypothetical protein
LAHEIRLEGCAYACVGLVEILRSKSGELIG